MQKNMHTWTLWWSTLHIKWFILNHKKMWQSTKSKLFLNNEGITSDMLLYEKISTENEHPIVNLQATPYVVDRLLVWSQQLSLPLGVYTLYISLLLSIHKTLFLTNRI